MERVSRPPAEGGRLQMVDVGEKPATRRVAEAEGAIRMSAGAFRTVAERRLAKGDVLTASELAGMLAAKRTAELIPLCHPLGLSFMGVEGSIDVDKGEIELIAEVRTTGPTGVEMEALTAASVAALTVYDMIKGIERGAEIASIVLLYKAGGRSGEWRRPS